MLPQRVDKLYWPFKGENTAVTRNQPFPITMKILLACHASSDPIARVGEPVWNSPAGKTSREWLFDNRLINDGHRVTDRGRTWLNTMFATPLPASE